MKNLLHIVLCLLAGALLWSCANIGSPEGGPRDYTPPVLVKSSPALGSLHYKGGKVQLHFDEIVQIKDQQKKVVVSPTQKNQPSIKVLGKSILVELNDELKPNTTYTIDFSDAIEDNNEGNRLDNFSYAFSTGDILDTLAISGIVLRASDLEPMQHVLVGIHSNLSDTAFARLPLERISRTNDKGEFTIHNLKPGRYHVFALNDMDGNYRMARSEEMAFLDEVIVPGVATFNSQDTTFTFDHRIDTVKTATHTEFLPNDVLLTMFREDYKPLYMKKNERQGRNKLFVLLSAPTQLPRLKVLKPAVHAPSWYKLETREGNDSLVYWLTDSTLIKSDSITIEMQHFKSDSAGALVMVHDTLNFMARKTNSEIKRAKEEAKEQERMTHELAKLEAEREKLVAHGKDVESIELDIEMLKAQRGKKREPLVANMEKKGTLDVTDSVTFKFEVPLDTIYQDRIALELMRPDSTWAPVVPKPLLKQVSPLNPMRFAIDTTLVPEGNYRLRLDSMALRSIYGQVNDSLKIDFKVRSLDDYGYIVLHVNGGGDSAVVELLDRNENVLRREQVNAGKVTFQNLTPGQYYLRLFIDRNGNGKWDTGNYGEHRQPEEVYYYPHVNKLKIRKGWGSEETWNIYATPLNLQKSDKIKRNKPEKRKDAIEQQKPDKDKTADEEDEFNSTGFGSNSYSSDKYRNYQNRR